MWLARVVRSRRSSGLLLQPPWSAPVCRDWRIARPRDGRIDEASVRAALAAHDTNGVFGGRIMAETLPELIADLVDADPGARTDVEVLGACFGRLEFVHLRRQDVVAQAVSWAKALQTHSGTRVKPWSRGAEILTTTTS